MPHNGGLELLATVRFIGGAGVLCCPERRAGIFDLEKILKNDGYDRSAINRALKELIQKNKESGEFGK